MNIRQILQITGVIAPCAFTAGCVQSHRYPPVVYESVPAATVPVPAPASERPAVQVYPDTAPPVEATVPAVPPTDGVASDDIALANTVRDVLKGQGGFASISRNIEASVQGGVVTLRGTVPTERDREEVVNRLARLPGVTRVDDQLGVDLR